VNGFRTASNNRSLSTHPTPLPGWVSRTDLSAKAACQDRWRRRVVMDHQWPHPAATAVDVTLLSRYCERFADDAVEIGRPVIFQATGTLIT
jgi:hypothetical protein